MKLKTLTTALALSALATINHQFSTALAQGSLTPPAGAPAPVMKSLDLIESRIPLNPLPGTNNALRVISQPGNYYLTSNVVGSAVTGIGRSASSSAQTPPPAVASAFLTPVVSRKNRQHAIINWQAVVGYVFLGLPLSGHSTKGEVECVTR